MANKRFIISDEKVLNTYGFRVLSAGIHFPAHVPAFDNHDTKKDPIGHWIKFDLIDGQWTAEFVPNTKTTRGKEVADMVEDGHLGQASIGIDLRSVQASGDAGLLLAGQKHKTVTKCIVPEVSIVNLASNRNAVALYDCDGPSLLNLSANDPSVVAVLSDITIVELPIKKVSMKKVTDFFKLSDEASEDLVFKAVKGLSDENAALRAELTAIRHTDRDKLIEDAIATGKIAATQKEEFVQLFDNSFDLAKKVLGGLQPKTTLNLADFTKTGNVGSLGNTKPTYNGKSWLELCKDEPDTLAQLKAGNYELFKLMYKADVGADWKE